MKKFITSMVTFLFIMILGFLSNSNEIIAHATTTSIEEGNLEPVITYGTSSIRDGADIKVKGLNLSDSDDVAVLLSNEEGVSIATKYNNSLFISNDNETTSFFVNQDLSPGLYKCYILSHEAYRDFDNSWNNKEQLLSCLNSLKYTTSDCVVLDYIK